MTEPRRDDYGRYLMVDPITGDERAFTRATTIAKVLEDTSNLEKWSNRLTAKGVAIRDDLRLLARSLDPEKDKSELGKLVWQAQEAAGSRESSNYGKALHGLTAQADQGREVDAPYPHDADLRVYRETLQAHGVVVIPDMVEVIVCLPELGVAGTFDRLVSFALEWYVDDVKTGANVDYPHAWALQLALYAHASHMTFDLGRTWEPMPRVNQERALVTHLPQGRAECSLWWVNIAAGWEAVQLAIDVRAWRKRKGLLWPIGVDMIAQPALQLVPEGEPTAAGDRAADRAAAESGDGPADSSPSSANDSDPSGTTPLDAAKQLVRDGLPVEELEQLVPSSTEGGEGS